MAKPHPPHLREGKSMAKPPPPPLPLDLDAAPPPPPPLHPPGLAAAPALAGPTAVALARANVVATMDQIRALRQTPQLPRAVHNTALKWLRDTHESPPGQPTVSRVPITYDDPLEIGVLDRGRGMAYTFVENRSQQWFWRSMLASFPDDVLEQVVGPGVVTITCEPWVGSYDHKRHHAARMGQGPALTGQAPVWDFLVTQRDGTQVRFHPDQTSRKVKVAYLRDGGAAPPEPPAAGLGESDGPKTYKHYKEASYPCDSGAASSANDAPAAPPSIWGPPPARPPPPRPPSSGALPAIPEHPPQAPDTRRGRGDDSSWSRDANGNWWYRDANGWWYRDANGQWIQWAAWQ